MAAYVVTIDTRVQDSPDLANIYAGLAEVTASHGGKYLIRTVDIESKGGAIDPKRMTVVEFESIEQARALFEDERFAELRRLRSQFVETNAFIVEGA